MLVFPVQILDTNALLKLADLVISSTSIAFFGRHDHKLLCNLPRDAKIEFDAEFFQIVSQKFFLLFATPF